MSNVKVWFSFGRAMTEYLLTLGHKVVATLRTPSALSDLTTRYPQTQLLVVKVTNPSNVTTAFAEAEKVFGRIDVVFNNAGLTRVSTDAVRFFREVNKPMGGRVLQVSSAVPPVGSTVHPLEGLSECLADELDPAWNIKVTIIEPGPYRTEIFQSNPQHPAYRDPTLQGSQFRKAAKVIEKVDLEEPPIRFPLHQRVVAAARDKAKNADRYERWNEDLYNDE